MYIISRIKEDKSLILGDMPNIEMKTMGGHIFWDTKKEKDSYKLQVNVFTKHARILDGADCRVAWGSYDAMVKKFRVLTCCDELVAGDVIGVRRWGGLYDHYAVYIGNDEVIHYAGQGKDFSDEISVHKAPMSAFLKDCSDFFVLDFPDEYGRPTKVSYGSGMLVFGDIKDKLSDLRKSSDYHLYSPEETVERAKSRLGETEYNLITENCEHFAIWCKTGISESHQVNDLLESMVATLSVEIR